MQITRWVDDGTDYIAMGYSWSQPFTYHMIEGGNILGNFGGAYKIAQMEQSLNAKFFVFKNYGNTVQGKYLIPPNDDRCQSGSGDIGKNCISVSSRGYESNKCISVSSRIDYEYVQEECYKL